MYTSYNIINDHLDDYVITGSLYTSYTINVHHLDYILTGSLYSSYSIINVQHFDYVLTASLYAFYKNKMKSWTKLSIIHVNLRNQQILHEVFSQL
jgi:hypothetical protein